MRVSRLLVAVSLVASVAHAQSSAPVPTAAAAPTAAPAPATHLVIPMHGHGSLEFDVPAGWRYEITQPERRLPATISLEPRADATSGGIQLTPLWTPDGRDISSARSIRESAEAWAKQLGAAIEQLKPLDGAPGWYLTVRDPNVTKDPDDYEYMTSICASAGKLMIMCTVLARVEDSPARQAAFALLRSVRNTPDEAATIPLALTAPSGKWDLRLDVPADFIVARRRFNEDRSGVMFEAGTREGWMLTAFVDRDKKGLSATAHRDTVTEGARRSVKALAAQAKGHEVKLVDLRTWEEGDRAMLAHGATFDGQPATRSRNVVFVNDGYWIDVHLSHSPPTEGDSAVFDAILKSVRME